MGFQLCRNVPQSLDGLLNAIDDRDGVGVAALLQNGDVNRALSIDAHDVVLQRSPVDGVTHVRDKHRIFSLGLKWDVIESPCVWDLGVGVKVVISGPNADIASRKNQIRQIRGTHNIHRTQLMRLQLQGVDVNHNLPVTATVWRGNRCSGNAGNLIANRKLQIVVELRLVKALTLDRQQAHGKTRGIHTHYHGGKRALWKT